MAVQTTVSPDRKSDHLRIAAGPGVSHAAGTGIGALRLLHRALPERSLDSVSLETELLGVRLGAPLVISAMTGGAPGAAHVNRALLRAAAEHGVAIALGSGRRLLGDPGLLDTYLPLAAGEPRPPLLLANLGAAQVREPGGPDDAERLVDLLGADGLSIHLNPLQEAVQPEGETNFAGVLDGIAAVAERLSPRPVVVKEVGFGLDGADVALLHDAGVAAVDVAGAGGTNWALVEGGRDPRAAELAAAFGDWGLCTPDAIRAACAAAPELPVIASGGVRDGVDVAKCLALGATAAGAARPFLLAAQAGHASEALGLMIDQLRIAAWLASVAAVSELSTEHLR